MPRQPSLPVHAGKPWGLGPTSVEQRPQIVAWIGRCVALWPFVEHNLALTLGNLLGIGSEGAIGVFMALRLSRTQHEVLTAAAQAKLGPAELALFKAVLSVCRTAELARNDLVHGNWGVCDTIPDAALWVHSNHHSVWNAKALAGSTEQGIQESIEPHFFIYRDADLAEEYGKITAARNFTFRFLVYLGDKERSWSQRADQGFHELSCEPQIAQQLSRPA